MIELFWLVILWAGVVVTLYLDGFDQYSHYFTNWMWTINAAFFTLDVLSFLDATGKVQFVWVASAFWPVYANVSQVFWLVFIMICDNDDVIGIPINDYGVCPVLLADRIKHILPFVVNNFYIILRHRDITKVLQTVGFYGWKFLVVYIILQVIFAHFVLFGYWSNFDFYSVYGLSINVWIGLAIVEVIYLLFLVVPIILLSPYMAQFWNDLDHKVDHFQVDPQFLVQLQHIPGGQSERDGQFQSTVEDHVKQRVMKS